MSFTSEPVQWEACSAAVVTALAALSFPSLPWLSVLSDWSDQLSGFYIFPQPGGVIVNSLIFWSFYPEKLNFVIQVEREKIVEKEKKYEKSPFSTPFILTKLK